MRRKKLLRQVAAAAVALSMAVSLSAPAFAATFDLSNGGLVITAGESGITVKQDGQTGSTSVSYDDTIEIKGSYSSPNGAALTAEENQQDENQPVTPAKAQAKAPATEETPEAEDAPAAEEKQGDTKDPADPEQNTETENKDKNNTNDPADEEEQKQEPKAEDEGQPKPEAKDAKDEDKPKTEANASAEATASASNDASNGPRKAQACSSGQGESSGEGERRGIIQIINNTVDKLIKLTLNNATIDQPNAADTNTRGQAAIDIQGSGNVEIKVKGNNTLNGYGNSAGIQKNDDVSTGKLTITAQDTNQKLTVKEDNGDVAIGGYGAGTKNIEINNGTLAVEGTIGSSNGEATGIKITGGAVVNVTGDIRGGSNQSNPDDIEFSGNANVTVKRRPDSYSSAKIGGNENGNVTISGNAQVRGDWVEINCNLTLKDQAKLEVIDGGDFIVKKDKLFTDETSDGAVLDVLTDIGPGQYPPHIRQFKENGEWKDVSNRLYGRCDHAEGKTYLSETVPPTCSTQGEKIYRCFYCGSVAKTEYMDCLPHTWVKGETVKPTCTEKGYTVYKCSVCGQTENREQTDALGHKWVKGKTVEPTCVAGGYTEYECSVCHETKQDDETDPTGVHTYTELVETVAPTYTEMGYTVYKCQTCDATEKRDWVPMLERESTNGAPNYTVTGAETYETSVVDGRYIIAVPSEDAALNAVLGDLRAIKAQGADVVVFRTRSRESSLVIDEMLAMGPDATPFVLAHNGSEARLTINGAAHNELIH